MKMRLQPYNIPYGESKLTFSVPKGARPVGVRSADPHFPDYPSILMLEPADAKPRYETWYVQREDVFDFPPDAEILGVVRSHLIWRHKEKS